ncbi:4Fe-4S dicluster domain-containing protein [Desulfuribacillus alkaliarsenatis]|uniref:4Fe-4S ferredoxin-type domain-containing protein n=1 Tax=Desulfuribacillus alkaliarsenatis TaxID=766136 RepID=A0A1E5G0Q4_9FIRM|nr:4Fe-4S dicluster domain-containing protein [Desulfuribacillus alkaliarsenatis]OEF96485.1 hypothetical protein BHF68_07460 [Desulfuribacillus alkaliarsenatis]
MGLFSRFINKYMEKKLVDCPIEIDKERCTAIGQLCQQICVHSCPNQAIAEGAKSIDEALCQGCGNCVTSCPNGAISFVSLHDDTILRNIIHHCKDKTTVRLSCNNSKHHKTLKNHKNSKSNQDDFDIERLTSINVDCLSRIHPGLMLAPLAVDAKYVWVDVSGCKDCPKNRENKVLENINYNFTEATEWLTQLEVDEARLMLASHLPEPILIATKKEIEQSSNYNRRDFFKNIGKGVRSNSVGVFGDVADQLVSDEIKKERRKIAQNQRTKSAPVQREILLEVIKKLAGKKTISGDLYYFDKLSIADGCNLCSICSRLCPTGAIELVKDKENQTGKIIYKPYNCLGCHKCESICPSKKIKYTDKIKIHSFVNKEQMLVLKTELVKCVKCKDYFHKQLEKDGKCTICQR